MKPWQEHDVCPVCHKPLTTSHDHGVRVNPRPSTPPPPPATPPPQYLDDVSYQSGFEDGAAAERARQAEPRRDPAQPVEPGPLTSDSAQRLAKVIEQAEATNPEWSRGARFVVGWYPAQAVEPGPLDVALRWLIDNSTPQHSAACALQDDDDPCICGVSERYAEVLALSPDTQPKGAG